MEPMPESLDAEMVALRERTEDLMTALRPLEEQLKQGQPAAAIRSKVAACSRERGFFGMTQPSSVGGSQACAMTLTVVREALARADLEVASYVFGPRPGVLIAAQGQLREEYLLPHLRGDKRGTFGFTESDVAPRPTWARQDGDDLVVNGIKSFVTHARGAQFVSALVNVEKNAAGVGGTAMVVIDFDDPGVSFEREFTTLEGGDHVAIRFADVRVPKWRVVGALGEGMPRALANISIVRLALSAQACGMMQFALEHVTEYIKAPHRSGVPLGDREGVRLRYADMRIEAFAARSMLYRTARLADSEANDVNEVMCTKIYCTEAAGRVIDGSLQLIGGNALTVGHPLERLYREVRTLRFTEGASDILRLNIARGKLDLDKGTL
ncbi:MAG: alkylation response protein AidB-like acyl-CoA dehydrogenase [Gammaproteobacteria bacterium]|jgi:alkylation response protein AidB-like acyl-CoA dehydrogenase